MRSSTPPITPRPITPRPLRPLALAFLGCALLLGAFGTAPASGQTAGSEPGVIPASATAPAPVVTEHPSPAELRQMLLPAFRALREDPEYRRLAREIDGLDDQEAIDAFLRYLPMSPKEILELDMYTRRYEHMVPKYIEGFHLQWIALHQELATLHYGRDAVTRAVGRVTAVLADLEAAEQAGAPEAGAPEALPPGVSVGVNRNAAATLAMAPELYQGEIQVVVDPNDPSRLVAGANTFDDMGGTCGDFGMQAVFYSSDGGETWGYTCTPDRGAYGLSCDPPDFFGTFGSDPALFWNDQGEVFLEHMLVCSGADTLSSDFAIVVAKSTDGGATWSAQGVVADAYGQAGVVEDKNFYHIDNHPQSPYYGRHYTCWDRTNDMVSAYSTDGAATWTEVDLPANPGTPPGDAGYFDLGCEIATARDGTVHIVYDVISCGSMGCVNEEMLHVRSTDGGATWSAPVVVRDFNLVGFSGLNCPEAQDSRCILPFGAIDVDNSGGPCDGQLYVTFTDFTTGDVNNTDVFVTRSLDDGATWETPVRVNDDGEGGNVQFHPFLVFDQRKRTPVVAWHDARHDPDNRAVDFYVARSVDCGQSFGANIRASQPSPEFNNPGIASSNESTTDNPNRNPNQYGEYLGLDVYDGMAFLAWTDTRHFFPASTGETQRENMGFAPVDLGPVLLFTDSFESGDTTMWSAEVPADVP